MINKTFIQSILTELLGCTVILAKQNGPKAKKPFATIRLYAFHGVGMNDEVSTTTPGQLEVKGTQECTLEVQYFGTDAEQKLIELKHALSKPTIADRCFGAEVVFFDVQNVQDLTGLQDDTKFEERASIDFSVRFVLSMTDEPGYVSQVNLNMNKNYDFTVKEENNA